MALAAERTVLLKNGDQLELLNWNDLQLWSYDILRYLASFTLKQRYIFKFLTIFNQTFVVFNFCHFNIVLRGLIFGTQYAYITVTI